MSRKARAPGGDSRGSQAVHLPGGPSRIIARRGDAGRAWRRRGRRYCPGQRRWACAAIAEASARAGSLQAVYDRLDAERAAAAAAAEDRRDRLAETIRAAAWRAQGRHRYREWLATPLQVPEWFKDDGWPEPNEEAA